MTTTSSGQPAVPTTQIPGVYRRRIGDIVVTAISDGYLNGSYDFTRNIAPQDAERILKEAYRPAPPRISVNTFVIHSAGRMALVDTGSQDSMGPTLGLMPKHFAAAGIDPKQIDTILLTHMHPDHSNGLTDANGQAIYPHVELVIAEREVAHWFDDAAMGRATERQQMRFFRWAREQIAPYQNQRREPKGEVFPGVTAVPLYGHTPGHTGYLVASRGAQIARVPGCMTVGRHGGDAGKYLALRLAALIMIGRDLLACPAEVAHLLALGRAPHRGIVEPVRDVALRDDEFDMRIDRLA